MPRHKFRDHKKQRVITIRLTEDEYRILESMAETLNTTKSDAMRKAMLIVRILCDKQLPLMQALKPIPELAKMLGVDLDD